MKMIMSLIAGAVIALTATAGSAFSFERFSILDGVSAERLADGEMGRLRGGAPKSIFACQGIMCIQIISPGHSADGGATVVIDVITQGGAGLVRRFKNVTPP